MLHSVFALSHIVRTQQASFLSRIESAIKRVFYYLSYSMLRLANTSCVFMAKVLYISYGM